MHCTTLDLNVSLVDLFRHVEHLRLVCQQINCRDPGHIPLAMGAGFEVLAESLDAAHQSLDFYEGQRSVLTDPEKLTSQKCSVCLSPNDDLADLVMLPCAHFFHRDCAREALATNAKCPYCRAHAPPKSMSSVLMEASFEQFNFHTTTLHVLMLFVRAQTFLNS